MRAAEFVDSYIDAWNHCDPKGVADHLTADGIYCDIPENVQRTHGELIASLNDFFSQNRHHYQVIGEVLAGRDTIAFQYQFHTPEKHGQDVATAYFGAEFIALNGDAAASITDYYDIPGVSKPSSIAHITTHEAQMRKYAKSGLNTEQLLEYKSRLEEIMQVQQAFLTPNLTLPKLAETVSCSVNHLSQVINAGFGMSFFDYLNQYRIQHAKELLAELNGQSNAILNIAFTVGFNSNSAFYAAFKKCVGKTPAQYRRAKLTSHH